MDLKFNDPETRDPLTPATVSDLVAIKKAIDEGRARRKDGGDVPVAFDGAYLSANRQRAYLIMDEIPNFLIEERLELDEPLS